MFDPKERIAHIINECDIIYYDKQKHKVTKLNIKKMKKNKELITTILNRCEHVEDLFNLSHAFLDSLKPFFTKIKLAMFKAYLQKVKHENILFFTKPSKQDIKQMEEYQEVLGDFKWVDKEQAIKEAYRPSDSKLKPCKEDSKNWDTTENLYIEGDNLEVLKLLQKSYYNKVKMIYIDPPYNTRKDFVYTDNFSLDLKEYCKRKST